MLKIYKGYEKEFLENKKEKALIKNEIEEKFNILEKEEYIQEIIKVLTQNVSQMQNDDLWITYEEFSITYQNIISLAKIFKIKIVVYQNNKYYNIYPAQNLNTEKLENIIMTQNDENLLQEQEVDDIYSYVYKIGEEYFVQYHNFEYDYKDEIEIKNRYNGKKYFIEKSSDIDYIFEISENQEAYLENLLKCKKCDKIGIKVSIDSVVTDEMYNGLVGFLIENKYQVYRYKDIEKEKIRHDEYIRIAKQEIGIPNFKSFKPIKIYKNAIESNETIQISQENIINEIVNQVEICKESEGFYRDIFVTAPTGAGKSIMFQIPAVYSANKYGGLSIVISPLVELMNDQVDNLEKRGYHKSARLNSDVNAFEKQEIIENIDKGNIDILYLSPEALLSYRIESIIGSRDIAMVIIDEAHIVTTWGQGFRPDYWYLGSYFEVLRKSRYKHGVLDQNAKIYRFPICTFTATAVFGGEDDGVLELQESLYLRDPVRFIGEIKRNEDISFDINVNDEKLTKSENEIRKARKLKERIKVWQSNEEKALVYFPYNSIATNAYYKRDCFEILDEIKRIGIYTGQTDKKLKKESAIQYKNGDIKVMFATKAFGMGIDIKDIKHVYHYAEAGNLNDYVQEIGRVARDEKLHGIAHMDYFDKDENYGKILFGMSAIKQFHVNGCIRVLYNIYKKTKRQNNLITPQAFETVFQKTNDLENTVKTALLNIEKDFNAKYRIPVIKTRPRTMFTSTYAMISKDIEKEFLKSEYGRYFKKISKGKDHVKEVKCIVTDMGDIYTVNLKRMWEDKFSELSFPSFKHQYYEEKEKIFGKYANGIIDKVKLEIQRIDDEKNLEGIRNELLNNIDIVSKIISKFQSKQGEFTMQQFQKELKEQFKDSTIAENVANGYFKCISDPLMGKSFYTTKMVGDIVKYKIVNSNYRMQAESLIYKSTLLKELDEIKKSATILYKSANKEIKKKFSKILNLLSMFNLVQYDMYGGENAEIFIRINEPERIRAIAMGDVSYTNKIVEKAAQKHKRDVLIMKKFIMDLKTDEERWNFIEEYFLGRNVLME